MTCTVWTELDNNWLGWVFFQQIWGDLCEFGGHKITLCQFQALWQQWLTQVIEYDLAHLALHESIEILLKLNKEVYNTWIKISEQLLLPVISYISSEFLQPFPARAWSRKMFSR